MSVKHMTLTTQQGWKFIYSKSISVHGSKLFCGTSLLISFTSLTMRQAYLNRIVNLNHLLDTGFLKECAEIQGAIHEKNMPK